MNTENTITPVWAAVEFTDIIHGRVYPVQLSIPQTQNKLAGFILHPYDNHKLQLIIPVQTDEVQGKNGEFAEKSYRFAQQNRSALDLHILKFKETKVKLGLPERDEGQSMGLEIFYVSLQERNMFIYISLDNISLLRSNIDALNIDSFTGELSIIMGWKITPNTLSTGLE